MPESAAFWGRFRRRLRSDRFVVRDASMAPGLVPGDRIWVDPRLPPDGVAHVGEIVVLRDPEYPTRTLIKRVVGRDATDGTVTVAGDARAQSRDSRAFGPVPPEAIVGVAWFRYLPRERRGLLGPPEDAPKA
jgi:nickel-type superoxide dismutase maturation protease